MRILITICILFLFQLGNAQDDLIHVNDKVSIETNDGNQFVGKILEIDGEKIILETATIGNLTIRQENIKSMESDASHIKRIVDTDKKGNPIDYYNSTHYMVNQSAYGLKKDQAYYENSMIFINTLAIGITDKFSITVGAEIASTIFAKRLPSIYITPKLSLSDPNDNVNYSVGATLLTATVFGYQSIGFVQAAVTKGNRNNNFTIGAGFGFTSSEGFIDPIVPIQLSFMTRLSKQISLISDNTILFIGGFNPVSTLSFSLRYHLKKNGAALNAGLFKGINELDSSIGIPYISATFPL